MTLNGNMHFYSTSTFIFLSTDSHSHSSQILLAGFQNRIFQHVIRNLLIDVNYILANNCIYTIENNLALHGS